MEIRFVVAALVLSAVAQVSGQAPDSEAHLGFEVASVKPNLTLGTNMSINDAPGGQLNCSNVTLRQLISFAYNVRDYQILEAPGWAGTERYDVLAKPSTADAAKEPARMDSPAEGRVRLRTQSLLADRFGLAVHYESREMRVYALVVANGGPKLAASKAEKGGMSWNGERVTCKKVTMKRFAEMLLASRFNRFVVDETGLTGEYDFEMHFVPDSPTPKPGETVTAADAPTGPTFEGALQEQLGLKLITTKAAVPFLVIDKAERPSAN